MKSKLQTRLLIALLVLVGVVLVVGANTHLLYVAISSAPDCVGHLKRGDAEPGRFSAARSDC